MRALLAIGALAACTYPEKIDRLECLGAPGPSSAKAFISLTGVTADPQSGAPFGGATLERTDGTLARIAGPVTSSATGGFGFEPFNTFGNPIDPTDIYIHGTAAERIETYFTPPRAIVTDSQIAFTMLTTGQFDLLATKALGQPFTAGLGVVLVDIRDCDGEDAIAGEDGIAGATLEASDGIVRYFADVFPDPAATATDNLGIALVANLPPGTVDLTVTVDQRRLPTRTVVVVPDAITRTVIMP